MVHCCSKRDQFFYYYYSLQGLKSFFFSCIFSCNKWWCIPLLHNTLHCWCSRKSSFIYGPLGVVISSLILWPNAGWGDRRSHMMEGGAGFSCRSPLHQRGGGLVSSSSCYAMFWHCHQCDSVHWLQHRHPKHTPVFVVSGSLVLTLLEPYLGRGHTLCVDNWYTSPTLFHRLLRAKTGACGTVRANSKVMPCFPDKMNSSMTSMIPTCWQWSTQQRCQPLEW